MSTEREFDMKLRIIAEDLCNNRECNISLRLPAWDQCEAVLETLGRHVTACNSAYRLVPVACTAVTGLSNRGVPFVLINSQTGQERLLQLTGGDPAVHDCQRASDDERLRAEASLKEYARRNVQQAAGQQQMILFLNALVAKLRAVAARVTLTVEQRSDFDYQMRSLGVTAIPQYAVATALADISNVCQVLGVSLEQLVSEK